VLPGTGSRADYGHEGTGLPWLSSVNRNVSSVGSEAEEVRSETTASSQWHRPESVADALDGAA
jgi:hypothetical protein